MITRWWLERGDGHSGVAVHVQERGPRERGMVAALVYDGRFPRTFVRNCLVYMRAELARRIALEDAPIRTFDPHELEPADDRPA